MRRFLKFVSSSVQAMSLSLLTVAAIAAPGSNSQAQSATPADGGTTTVSCPCTNGNDCGPPTYNANTGYSCPNPANCGAAANCQIKVVINNPITD